MKNFFRILVVLVLATVFFLCASCTNDTKPVAPETQVIDAPHNTLRFTVGQKWNYTHTMINKTDSGCGAFLLPETLCSFINYSAVKDTLISNDTFIIVEGVCYQPYVPVDQSVHSRVAIHFGLDSVRVLAFKGFAFIEGLLKAHAADVITAYDTATYNDLFYPVIFPLSANTSWYYRPANDPRGNFAMRKTYLGLESITTSAGTFNAFKTRWELEEALAIQNITRYDWTTEAGLIRRVTDYGIIDMTNEVGEIIGKFYAIDYTEYCGAYNIDPDTLSILQPFSIADKAFADQHFSPEKYLAYRNYIFTSPDSLVLWDLATFQLLPDSIEGSQAKTDAYYMEIAANNALAQGWDDVTPDMVGPAADSFHYINTQSFGTLFDERYRGFAIDSLVFDINGAPVDTVWLHYDDACSTQPLKFGASANQKELRRRLLNR
ncbi:MAG: hypothetical protein V1913_16095 [Fibrobacterota bacterium]